MEQAISAAAIYDYTYSMKRKRNIVDRLMRSRSTLRRDIRLLFPSPAEMRFVELMGGKVYRINIKHPGTKFPLAVVYKKPTLFKQENIKREVRCGRYYVDFANDIAWGIEIDGDPYHMDVLADLTREGYLIERGWRIMRIRADKLYNDKSNVQREVLAYFLK